MIQQTIVTNSQLKEAIAKPNFGNDYNSYFHATGTLPQEHISNREEPYKGYPKLQKLLDLKREHQQRHAGPIVSQRASPAEMPALLQEWTARRAQFDVIMVGGCVPDFESLERLPIDRLGPRPSILFFWVPSWKLDEGRQLLEKWGYRRSEDIVFSINSQNSKFAIPTTDESRSLVLRPTAWHCFMGLKGTLRRSDDAHLINCNVDTDVILESAMTRPNIVPEQIYDLVERFTSMNRRIHILPFKSPEHLPVRLRRGWLILTPDTMLSNVELGEYMSRSCVPVDPEIDALRPKTPPRVANERASAAGGPTKYKYGRS